MGLDDVSAFQAALELGVANPTPTPDRNLTLTLTLTPTAFQAALESRSAAERAEVLRDGVRREAARLAARAAVRRAFDAS